MSHRGSGFDDPAVDAVLLGVFFIAAGIYQTWRGWGTGNWKPTPAEVTEVYMSEVESQDDDDSKPSVDYKSRVMYTYKVFGKEYEGGTLQRGLFRIPIKYFAEQQIAGYRRGQRVTAYYCPSDPSHAVLKRGAPPSAFIMFVIGLILLALGWKFWG